MDTETTVSKLFYNATLGVIIETNKFGIEYPFSGDELRKVCYNKNMNKNVNKYPILQGLINSGDITLMGTTMVGHASDGVEVAIGEDTEKGYANAERYLTDHPTPDTW